MTSKIFVLAAVLAQLPASSQIQVRVSRSQTSDGLAYQYKLIHNGRVGQITRLVVGCDATVDSDCELPSAPVGVVAPTNWMGRVVRTEGATLGEVDWTNTSKPLKPGERDCFGITVDTSISQYEMGHFTVYFEDGRKLAGQLTPDQPVSGCNTPPIAIVHPGLGDALAETVPISAVAFVDASRWNLLSVLLDGQAVDALRIQNGLQFNWNTHTVPNGLHRISARVRTQDGTEVETGGLQVNVQNP